MLFKRFIATLGGLINFEGMGATLVTSLFIESSI